LYYDHLITMRREIQYLWKRPKRPSMYWFFVNRYFLFSTNILVALFSFTTFDLKLPQSCERYNLSRQTLLALNQFLVAVMMTLRIYALYGCSSRVLGSMIIIGIAPTSVSCWALSGQKNKLAQQVVPGCHVGLSYNTSIRLAAAWESLFVYDLIIFVLTLAKTWRAGKHVTVRTRLPVLALLLRDGAIYFAVMALANLANILTFYVCPFLRGGLSTFSSSICVTMMSRFMLNLHETTSVGILSTHSVSPLEFLEDSLEPELPRNTRVEQASY
ncbi:hypothetical protein BD779DRAFT_1438468, partial [Infundibulicybe gibba]